MIKINKILTAIDFSAHKNFKLDFEQPNINSLKYGCEIASKFNAELHVVHVVQVISEIEMVTHDWENASRKTLNEISIKPSNPKITVIREIRKGRPFIEIIKYAREINIDLIIIGSHGHKALSQLLIGSEAENLVRKAPCPVLVVRHPEHEFVMP